MHVRPTRGKILGKVLDQHERLSSSGLLVIEKAQPNKITVVAVGNYERDKKGKDMQHVAHVGDIAHVKKHSGWPVMMNREKFLFVKNGDIVARENEKGLHAVRDMIIAEVKYEEMMSKIIVPDSAKQYSGDFCGVVVAVGPEYRHRLNVGDRVRFTRHEGFKISYKDKEYLSLKHRWVVGVERD